MGYGGIYNYISNVIRNCFEGLQRLDAGGILWSLRVQFYLSRFDNGNLKDFFFTSPPQLYTKMRSEKIVASLKC